MIANQIINDITQEIYSRFGYKGKRQTYYETLYEPYKQHKTPTDPIDIYCVQHTYRLRNLNIRIGMSEPQDNTPVPPDILNWIPKIILFIARKRELKYEIPLADPESFDKLHKIINKAINSYR